MDFQLRPVSGFLLARPFPDPTPAQDEMTPLPPLTHPKLRSKLLLHNPQPDTGGIDQPVSVAGDLSTNETIVSRGNASTQKPRRGPQMQRAAGKFVPAPPPTTDRPNTFVYSRRITHAMYQRGDRADSRGRRLRWPRNNHQRKSEHPRHRIAMRHVFSNP